MKKPKLKFRSLKGLARIIANKYTRNFECCLMKDKDSGKLYLLGFAIKSFPSSNKDEVIYRVRVESESEILSQITYYDEEVTIIEGVIHNVL